MKNAAVYNVDVWTSHEATKIGPIWIGWFRLTIPQTDNHWSWAWIGVDGLGSIAFRPCAWVFNLVERLCR